jgi:hypothetical protein
VHRMCVRLAGHVGGSPSSSVKDKLVKTFLPREEDDGSSRPTGFALGSTRSGEEANK